jgi:hypothetical protein
MVLLEKLVHLNNHQSRAPFTASPVTAADSQQATVGS